MSFHFYNSSIDALYLKVLQKLLGNPFYEQTIRSSPRGMPITEMIGASVTLEDPRRCAISLAERKLNYHFMVAEFWWICSGDDRVASIVPYCQEIAKFSDDGQTFFGAYGARWRPQVEKVIQLLRTDPDSRQAVVVTWRPILEWLMFDQSEFPGHYKSATKDVPCTLTMQYLVRGGELRTIVTMRSWDAWLGLPYDLFNFSMLAACVAAELGLHMGPLTVQAGSLHLYDRNIEQATKLVEACYHTKTYPPEMPRPDKLPAVDSMRALEGGARGGYVGTAVQPWTKFVQVLVDRHRTRDNRFAVDEPFRTLIYGKERQS